MSTTNWNTFAELAFSFEMSSEIVIYAFIFAVIMGLVGGFLARVVPLRRGLFVLGPCRIHLGLQLLDYNSSVPEFRYCELIAGF